MIQEQIDQILHQLSFFKNNWDEKTKIEQKAKAIIDSEWHYSWHWKRDKNGYYLVPEGWEQALKDGTELRDGLQKHVDALNKLLLSIESIVKENQLRQKLEELYELQDSILDDTIAAV